MGAAQQYGINYFDTANVDGSKGGTERILGAWFATGGQRRERTVLATKVYGEMTDWPTAGSRRQRNHIGSAVVQLRRTIQANSYRKGKAGGLISSPFAELVHWYEPPLGRCG
jgi:aryl-alcohol dehydrogenase-like predicted oxidoreductase